MWWPGTESNRRRQPFQGWLRPELSLSYQRTKATSVSRKLPVFGTVMGQTFGRSNLPSHPSTIHFVATVQSEDISFPDDFERVTSDPPGAPGITSFFSSFYSATPAFSTFGLYGRSSPVFSEVAPPPSAQRKLGLSDGRVLEHEFQQIA